MTETTYEVKSELGVEPESAGYGGGTDYWNKRFAEDAALGSTFDWLFEYKSLRNVLRDYVPSSARVLNVGCGNSQLAIEWCMDGHTGDIVNVDNSRYIIEMLEAEHAASWANLRFIVGDVRCLGEHEFASDSFDVVIDKATFDCVACNPANQKDLEAMLRSIFRVLRPGGVYLLISCEDPESRMPWLVDEPGLDWTVSVRHMAIRSHSDTEACHYPSLGARDIKERDVIASHEVMLTNNDVWEADLGTLIEDAHTFVYVCRKLCRGNL